MVHLVFLETQDSQEKMERKEVKVNKDTVAPLDPPARQATQGQVFGLMAQVMVRWSQDPLALVALEVLMVREDRKDQWENLELQDLQVGHCFLLTCTTKYDQYNQEIRSIFHILLVFQDICFVGLL